MTGALAPIGYMLGVTFDFRLMAPRAYGLGFGVSAFKEVVRVKDILLTSKSRRSCEEACSEGLVPHHAQAYTELHNAGTCQ